MPLLLVSPEERRDERASSLSEQSVVGAVSRRCGRSANRVSMSRIVELEARLGNRDYVFSPTGC